MRRHGRRLRGLEAKLDVRSEGMTASKRRGWICAYAVHGDGPQPNESEWDAALRGWWSVWCEGREFDREEADDGLRGTLDHCPLHAAMGVHPENPVWIKRMLHV